MIGIINGRVYDPCNGIDGEIRDIWVKDGRIVSPAEVDRSAAEIIDADGMVVMPYRRRQGQCRPQDAA
jgi:formylmethanofuran dehydrogenase subunit A